MPTFWIVCCWREGTGLLLNRLLLQRMNKDFQFYCCRERTEVFRFLFFFFFRFLLDFLFSYGCWFGTRYSNLELQRRDGIGSEGESEFRLGNTVWVFGFAFVFFFFISGLVFLYKLRWKRVFPDAMYGFFKEKNWKRLYGCSSSWRKRLGFVRRERERVLGFSFWSLDLCLFLRPQYRKFFFFGSVVSPFNCILTH